MTADLRQAGRTSAADISQPLVNGGDQAVFKRPTSALGRVTHERLRLRKTARIRSQQHNIGHKSLADLCGDAC